MIDLPILDVSSAIGIALVFTAFIILLAAVFVIAKIMKKLLTAAIMFLLNSLAGLILLFVLIHLLNFDIPLNIYTIAASMLFGIAGVATIALLSIGSVI